MSLRTFWQAHHARRHVVSLVTVHWLVIYCEWDNGQSRGLWGGDHVGAKPACEVARYIGKRERVELQHFKFTPGSNPQSVPGNARNCKLCELLYTRYSLKL